MFTTTKERRGRLVARAAAVVVVAGLAGGAAYAQSATTVSATDTVLRLAAHTGISSTFKSPILSVRLPAGTYLLSGYGDIVNFGPSDYTHCQIMVDGVESASVSTIVGNRSAGTQGPAGYLSPFSLSGGVKVGAPGATATLQCWHDSMNGATPYVDDGATLVVHQTPSLEVITK